MDPRNGGSEDEDDAPAFIGDDAEEVIDIEPGNNLENGSDDFDDNDMEMEEEENEEEPVRTPIRPERDDSSVVFNKHTDAVLCACIDWRTCSLAVTGGQDDLAYVWRLATGEVLFQCTGHKESVNCVGFSADSSYVATADMGGLVKVWSVEASKEIWSFEVSEIEWLRWHKVASVLMAGTTDGEVWLWNIPSSESKTLPGFGSKCTVGEFMPDGKRACIGYDDGTVKVFDLKTCVVLHTYNPQGSHGHTTTVTCLSCHHDNRLVLSGSTDGTSLLLNSENGKVLTRFDCKSSNLAGGDHAGEDAGQNDVENNSVEAVGFSPSFNYAATGTVSGLLTVWDMASQTPRYQFQHKEGIVKLCWHPTTPTVYTASLDGCVYSWNARDGCQIRQYQGHTAYILDMDLARSGSLILTAGDDFTSRLFNLESPT